MDFACDNMINRQVKPAKSNNIIQADYLVCDDENVVFFLLLLEICLSFAIYKWYICGFRCFIKGFFVYIVEKSFFFQDFYLKFNGVSGFFFFIHLSDTRNRVQRIP